MGSEEIKKLAWERLWRDRWFGRLFGGGVLLGLCGYAVNAVLTVLLRRLEVTASWRDYAMAVVRNRQELTTPVPVLTNDYVFQATSSMALELFLSYVMTGIAAYGGAVILRRCLANEDKGWLAEAFGGFAMPFGMFWLFFRQVLICFGWFVVACIPAAVAAAFLAPRVLAPGASVGTFALAYAAFALAAILALLVLCVPFYRYRFLWLVKAEHPDWAAGACLAACRRVMSGNLLKSVRLDCAYWKPILLVLVWFCVFFAATGLAAAGIAPLLSALVASLAFCGMLVSSVVLGQYVGVGQGFLYRELCKAREGEKS